MSLSGRRICELAQEAAGAPDAEAALRTLTTLRQELDDYERQQVASALTAGRSYTDVAGALGITRQAAHRRFRDLAPSRRARRRGLPANPEVRLVFAYARSEALALSAASVQPGHVLLGILRTADRRAARALATAGVTLEGARLEAMRPPTRHDPDGKRAVEAGLARALRSAEDEGAAQIRVDHLLRGILPELQAKGALTVPVGRVIEALERAPAEAPAPPGSSARDAAPRFRPRRGARAAAGRARPG